MQLMIKACYNPKAQLRVEKKLEELVSATEPIKYFNTHPPEKERVKNIEEWLPPALEKYNTNCRGVAKQFMSALKEISGR
jgi:predicted Zn-dependent protease